MIEDLKKYNLPLKYDNFFVKKAEIELKESLEIKEDLNES